jgi:histidine transporter
MAHTPEGSTARSAADPGLQRGLSTRHIVFIALGTAIGTGLFYGSAPAIQTAGPAVVLAYMAAGLAVFMVMRALGEMAVREPVSGSFGAYAHRYLGPFAGFVTGWTYVFELSIVVIADVTAVALYMRFWYPDSPAWVWIGACILFIGAVNLTHVGNFGELEFWLSIIKVVAILGMIIGGIVLMVMGMSYDGETTAGLHNLVEHGGFMPEGFTGVLLALAIVVFSFGGIETIGITAGEAKDAAGALPKAINTVPARILIFYVGTMIVIMSLVPWNAIDGKTSPFVQIFDALGVPFAPHILNFVVLTAAVSAVNACTYSIGRLLYAMAGDGHAPRAFRTVSSNGVPWAAVGLVLGVMVVGALINTLWNDVFVTVAQVATFAVVFTWMMILMTHRGMRKAMARHGEEPGSFALPGGAFTTWTTMAFIALVIGLLAWDPDSRQALLVGLVWLAVLTAVWFLGARRHGHRNVRTGTMPLAVEEYR